MAFSWHKDIVIQKRPVFTAMLFFFLGLLIFGLAFHAANSHIKNLSRERFLKETSELTENLQYRINAGITTLYHVKGFFESSMLVEPHEWKKYIEITEVLKRNSSLTALSYIERVPEESREVFLNDIRKTFPDYKIFPESNRRESFVVKYAETRRQSKVLGFDVASDSERSKAIAKARNTGMAVATDAFPVPNAIETNIVTPVFSIFAPVYTGEQKVFQGIISTAFALQDFFPSGFGKQLPRGLKVKVSNGSTIFYQEGDLKEGKVLTDSKKISVADIEWNINFSAIEEFGLSRIIRMLPMSISLLGFLFSIIFALAVYFLLASRERAVILAKNITAQIEAVLTSIGEGLFATDKDGNIVLANREFGNILGWQATEIYGKKFYQVLPMLDKNKKPMPENMHPITKILQDPTATTATATTYFQRKDKTIFPVALNASPITVEGKLIGAVEVFRDISTEAKTEKAKSEFISIASHQLRTPVSSLSWLAEALQFTSENLSPKQKTYVKDLAISAKLLSELLEDLLDFSRIELKKDVMLEKHQIEVVGFLEEFVEEMKLYALSKKHNIILKKEFAKPTIIEVNRRALYNVLQNLLSNAIDYSPENTIVTIVLENIGAFIKISIANNGPAIPKEDQPHIFERFYRSESAKKMKAEGTGLGLYIVKATIEEIGGNVGFKSEEGGDTVFWFTIPIEKHNKRKQS